LFLLEVKLEILLATLGSAGDVHPIIGLAIALKNRGHKVKLITNPYFKTLVESVGIEFIGLGSTQDYLSAVENPDMWNPRKGFKLVAEGGVLPIMRPLYEIITSHDPKKTIVAASSFCLGARLAQEKQHFRLATFHLQPAIIRTTYETPVFPGMKLPERLPRFLNRLLYSAADFFILDPILTPGLNSFRKELGLAPVKHIFGHWMHSPEKVIGFFPEWFAKLQPDWPQNTELTGFIHFDGSNEKDLLNKDIADFIDNKTQTLVFTPGTAMKHAKDFFQVSVQVTQKLGKQALFLTKFKSHLPNNLPSNIKHVEYIPFSLILPKITALIHHGGIGTSAQALAAAIPQLIMPLNHDQPDNAARLERLGVATSIFPENYTVETVSQKLSYLLNSTKVLTECQNLKKKVDFNKALNATCEVLENLGKTL